MEKMSPENCAWAAPGLLFTHKMHHVYTWLPWNVNTKLQTPVRSMSLPMTLSDFERRARGAQFSGGSPYGAGWRR